MKYALINDQTQEAQPGLTGECRCCGSTTLAKCGKVKVWHWAHKRKKMCDSWWESETEWHRNWKNQFPKEFQEVIQYADNGEKHIADVKTDQGFVIEFQHSFIKTEERNARENFYKMMIWIVDGSRRTRDENKFIEVINDSKPTKSNAVRRLLPFHNECALFRDWDESKNTVFFDFGHEILWGLIPLVDKNRYVFQIHRNDLINSLLSDQQEKRLEDILKKCIDLAKADEKYWQVVNLLENQRRVQPRISNFRLRQQGRRRF